MQQEPVVYGYKQAGYVHRLKEGSGRAGVESCEVLTWGSRILEQLQTAASRSMQSSTRLRSRIATCQRCPPPTGNGPVNSDCTFYTGTNPSNLSHNSKINK